MAGRTTSSPTVGALLCLGLSVISTPALSTTPSPVLAASDSAEPTPILTDQIPGPKIIYESDASNQLPLRTLGPKLAPVPAPFKPEDFGDNKVTIVDSPSQLLAATAARRTQPEQEPAPDPKPEPEQAAAPQDITPQRPPEQAKTTETPPEETDNGNPEQATVMDDPSGELVLGLTINRVPMVEFVTGLDYKGRHLIGLGSLSQAFEFPIEVSPYTQAARGWFVRERNSFKVRGRTVILRGNSRILGKDDIVVHRDDIYIDAGILGSLLGLTFAIDLPTMMLTVTSDVPLPFEEKLRRQQREAILHGSRPEATPASFQRVNDPYLPYEFPYVDFSIMPTFRNKEGARYSSTYSILSKGDLAYLTTEIFLSGDLAGQQKLGDSRFNFSRTDENRGILGPLHASQMEFGDIESSSLTLVANSSSGRGLRLSNRSLYRADQVDSVTLRGVVPPGWDVELYRNGALVDIQSVGGDGKYEFVDVPIFLGRNSFRTVLYGPRGEVEEETKEYYAGSVLLDAGDVTYNLSLTDNNKTLTGAGNQNSPSDGVRMLGEVEYGLSKWLTLAGGFGQIGQTDSTYHYFTSGLRASLGGVLGSLDTAFAPENSGMATRASLAANFWDVDMSLQQSFYHNFISDENRNTTRPLSRTTNLSISSPLNVFGNNPMTLGFNAIQNRYANGDTDTILRNTTSQSLWGVSVTNSMERDFGTNPGTQGNLALRASVARVTLGVTADYTLKPESDLQQVNLTGQFHWSPEVLNRFTATTNARGDYEYSNSIVLDRRKYSLTLFAGNNSENSIFVGVGLNFSFNKLPGESGWNFQSRAMAESGGAAIQAFLDKNANGQWDSGEDALSGVGFLRGGLPVTPVSDTMGFVAPLAPDNPTRLSLDKARLGNPMRGSVLDGCEILPRPGHTTRVALPVVEMSLVEGSISTGTDGAKKPASYVRVELVSADGSVGSATTSEFDGYYMFEKVVPGTYTLRVTGPDGSPFAGATASRQVEVGSSEFYTFDIDLPARPAPSPQIPAPVEADKAQPPDRRRSKGEPARW